MKADGHTAKAIAKYLGVSRATLYRYLTEDIAAETLHSRPALRRDVGVELPTDDASARCSAQLFDSSGHHRGVVVQHVR